MNSRVSPVCLVNEVSCVLEQNIVSILCNSKSSYGYVIVSVANVDERLFASPIVPYWDARSVSLLLQILPNL